MREQDEADGSGSTAQFRAFVDGSGGPEATQAWSVHAQRNRTRTLVVAGGAVLVLLVIIAVLIIH